MYYVYLLRCADDSLYCGFTTDLQARVQIHNDGKGAKYTRSRLPVQLVHQEAFDNRSAALQREAAIKKLNRTKKEQLIMQS